MSAPTAQPRDTGVPVLPSPPTGTGWVDVHTHLLPGLDDGPDDFAGALALARALANDGVTHAVASPHLFGPYADAGRVDRIRDVAADLAERLAGASIPLTVYLGADTRIDTMLADELARGGVITVGDAGRYLLLEPPHDVWIEPAGVVAALAASGIVPVLTHPERHPHVQRRGVAVLQDWVDGGAVLQVTAASLLGGFGPAARDLAWSVLEAGVPALVASDAHDTRRRPPQLGEAARLIATRLDTDAAERWCRRAPWRLVADAIPVAPGSNGREGMADRQTVRAGSPTRPAEGGQR